MGLPYIRPTPNPSQNCPFGFSLRFPRLPTKPGGKRLVIPTSVAQWCLFPPFFRGKGSPLNSTNQKRMPILFSPMEIHRASEWYPQNCAPICRRPWTASTTDTWLHFAKGCQDTNLLYIKPLKVKPFSSAKLWLLLLQLKLGTATNIN